MVRVLQGQNSQPELTVHVCKCILAYMDDQSNSYAKIMKAAYSLFQHKGIDSTSTKEIAKAAKVNEVTIFRLFKTKKDLATEVINKHGPGGVIAKLDLLELTDDQEANLYVLTMTLITYHSENKAFMKFVFHNLTAKRSLPHLSKMLDPLLNWLIDYLTHHTNLMEQEKRKFAVEFSSVVAMRSIRKAITGSPLPFEEDDSSFARFHARIFAAALKTLAGQIKD